MKPNIYLLCLFLLFTAVIVNGQNIDAKKAFIGFELHVMACKKIRGSFSDIKGTFVFDRRNPSKSIIDFCINVSSVSTEEDKYKANLQNDKFFYFDKYPKIFFKADSVVNARSGYKAFGTLELNGEKKQIEVDINLTDNQMRGKTKIKRHDFNIATEKYPFSFPVKEFVDLEINYLMNQAE